MWKKLLLLLVVVLFAFGASGGCLNEESPDLSGSWKGKLSRSINPTIPNFADVTMELEQDSSGNLWGSVDVKYNPGASNEEILPTMTILEGSSTDALKAKITAKGINNTGEDIVVSCGNTTTSFTIPNGAEFTFQFELPHFYACRGGNLTELVGGYVLIYDNNTLDSGSVNLTKE